MKVHKAKNLGDNWWGPLCGAVKGLDVSFGPNWLEVDCKKCLRLKPKGK
jgi:hypothetical protein